MEKKYVYGDIFYKVFNEENIYFSDLPKDLRDDDVIVVVHEEEHFGTDSAYDAHTVLIVKRKRLETDEEYNNRIAEACKFKEELQERRYQTYLKLKEEFDA